MVLFGIAGFYQMAVWAGGKHRNYKKEFKDYPKGRRCILPFLLWGRGPRGMPTCSHPLSFFHLHCVQFYSSVCLCVKICFCNSSEKMSKQNTSIRSMIDEYLKPMYSFGKWWKWKISWMAFVYRVVWVLKSPVNLFVWNYQFSEKIA